MLLYILGASKLTMLYVMLNAVAAIAAKALIVAKMALAIATAIALKKASGEWNASEIRRNENSKDIVSMQRRFPSPRFWQGERCSIFLSDRKEKVSYEIIKHPHQSYEHTHSSSYDYDHHGGFEEKDLNYRKRRRIYWQRTSRNLEYKRYTRRIRW